ncbi:PREDICTED: F-box protein At4g27050-like [Camelina sativa]|uniref:F-box protein At4g27050-like n=1 Tax=Camelina sativa TaxID=90675 RepID=A0ABM0URP3_CAMSA|nr:PREDICTED: F-box protein At4g27050-like [Camelina sativa]
MATDLISNLPDDVLGKILSFVPTKVAASTSVLSKRWRNLLPLVDTLDFDESMLFYPNKKVGNVKATNPHSRLRRRHRFSDFVDKTLALLSNSPRIKKCSLICDYEEDESRINRWIRTVLDRGCLELNLASRCRICIDSQLFTSNTLVKLTISEGFHPQGSLPLDGLFFPALKTLTLLSVSFTTLDMHKFFIHGCPALEEIFIDVWMLYLSSPNVKRVTITSDFDDKFHLRSIKLETPSLLYLDYSSYVAGVHYVVLDSLVEARLDIRLYEKYEDDDGPLWSSFNGNVTSLLEGIRTIKSLHLSRYSLEVFYFCCNKMPLFDDLVYLSIESDEDIGWQVMPILLESSPNLQTLVIKGLVHKVTDWCGDACACIRMKDMELECILSICRVKVLEISGYAGSFRELKQMRHFLGKLECLETVKISVEEDSKNLKYLQANVMALPRVSSKCKIQFT